MTRSRAQFARPPRRHGEPEAGGKHWRILTKHGPMHLWIPGGYDAATAGIAVYVHGLYTTVDDAWLEHRLADQFAASRRNALFIAPEVPKAGIDQPNWDSLSDLLEVATRRLRPTGTPLPVSPDVVVLGHSGAYRTMSLWLNDPIRHLVLVDALYGNEDDFAAWINGATPGGGTRQLTIVAYDTLRWSEPFVDRFNDVVVRPQIPDRVEQFSPNERGARILYLLSQHEHMDMITQGRVLPVLLQQTCLGEVRAVLRMRSH